MYRRHKLSLMLLIAALLVGLLSACSQNDNGGNNQPGQNAGGDNGASENAGNAGANNAAADEEKAAAIRAGEYKFEEPVTITTVKATDNTIEFKNGETVENNVHTQWARDELGIDIEYLWQVPGDQFATKIRLMLTSGEQLPDILETEDMTLLNEMIESGYYRDITEDFEMYASDWYQEVMGSDPLMWSQMMYDGKKMGLPGFANAGNDNAVMWIRQDLLDELDMEAPTTFEELEALMQAMKDEQPGSVDNLIPLGLSLGAGGGSNPNPFAGWLGESTWVFGPSGTIPAQWLLDEETDTLVHGSTKPEMKAGLERIKSWYDKGFISKEAGLHDENKLAELTGQGRIGILVAPYWLMNWPVPDLQKNVPGATMNPFPVPTLDGVAAARDTKFLRGGMLVRKDFEHADALFLYLNRLVSGRDAGGEFENGFAEDYDYTVLDDGTISTEEDAIPGGKVSIMKYFLYNPTAPFDLMQMMDKIASGAEPETAAEVRMTRTNPNQLRAGQIVNEGWEQGVYIPTQFTGANTPALQSKGGILAKLEGETFTSMIYGKKPISDFDSFVEEWKKIGGQQVTDEVNAWYAKK
ncbi:extracellular solute-binding protein [Paenibacillus sp. IB182496]|uniref:Extracellular solute-binding protein n=1 Tax=Paenibacillus sabuli TaxID=2772509 RepID=A0A927GTS2_9BACL|nr:extracellular solute-binding protein [Paenibacillus sabuli]MBD2846992.1 extracellular solute-binding protein [Paenibacillus sabuli]